MKLRFNRAAFPQIRRWSSTERMVGARARLVAERCGGEDDGYFVQTSLGRSRARAVVIAGSPQAVRENAVENTLLRSLDAGRG